MHAKIFVINLDRSKDRLDSMKTQLDNLNLAFERIAAIDGRCADEDSLNKHYSQELNRKKYFTPLTKGEIGCYLSHLSACKKIVDESLDYGIILEDDIILDESFKFVHNLLGAIKDWNYIKLVAPFKKKKIISREPIKLETTKTFELIRWIKPPVGTPAYAISFDGAKEFLSKRSVFFRPVDVDLQFTWETNLDVIGISPDLCKISNTESTIDKRKLKMHYPLARIVYKLKYLITSKLKWNR